MLNTFSILIFLGTCVQNANTLFQEDAGKEDWAIRTIGGVSDAFCESNNVCYVGSDLGTIGAIDSVTGSLKWRVLQEKDTIVTELFDFEGVVVAKSINPFGVEYLRGFSKADGSILWFVDSTVNRSVIQSNEKLYLSYDGKFSNVNIQTGILSDVESIFESTKTVHTKTSCKSFNNIDDNRGTVLNSWSSHSSSLVRFSDDSLVFLDSSCNVEWIREEGIGAAAASLFIHVPTIAAVEGRDIPSTALNVALNPMHGIQFVTSAITSIPSAISNVIKSIQTGVSDTVRSQADSSARKKAAAALGTAGVSNQVSKSLHYNDPVVFHAKLNHIQKLVSDKTLPQAVDAVNKLLPSAKFTFGRQEVGVLVTKHGRLVILHLASGIILKSFLALPQLLLAYSLNQNDRVSTTSSSAKFVGIVNNAKVVSLPQEHSILNAFSLSRSSGQIAIHYQSANQKHHQQSITFIDIDNPTSAHTASILCDQAQVMPDAVILPSRLARNKDAALLGEHPLVCLSPAPFLVSVIPEGHVIKFLSSSIDKMLFAAVSHDERGIKATNVKFMTDGSMSTQGMKWSTILPSSETLISLSRPMHAELGNTHVHVHAEASVSIKQNANELLIALVRHVFEDSPSKFSSYIVRAHDPSTGSLLWSRPLPTSAANAPIHVVAVDNFVLVIYRNTEAHRIDILAIDTFKGDILSDPISVMITNAAAVEAASSETRSVARSYALALSSTVTAAGVTASSLGVSTRSIILALPSGQILAVPRNLLSPMRQQIVNGQKPADQQDGLPPFEQAVIPIHYTNMLLSHLRKLAPARAIASVPTERESSTFVVTLGQDVFGASFQPADTRFDHLSPTFSVPLLLTSVVGLTILTIFSINWNKKDKRNNAWK